MLVTVQFPGDDFSELLVRHKHNQVPARYPEEARYTPFIKSPETSLLSKDPGTLQSTLVLSRSAVNEGGFNHIDRRGETSGNCTSTHCTEEVERERVLHPPSPQDGGFHGVVGHHFSDVAD